MQGSLHRLKELGPNPATQIRDKKTSFQHVGRPCSLPSWQVTPGHGRHLEYPKGSRVKRVPVMWRLPHHILGGHWFYPSCKASQTPGPTDLAGCPTAAWGSLTQHSWKVRCKIKSIHVEMLWSNVQGWDQMHAPESHSWSPRLVQFPSFRREQQSLQPKPPPERQQGYGLHEAEEITGRKALCKLLSAVATYGACFLQRLHEVHVHS